jgi:hypothetical protein
LQIAIVCIFSLFLCRSRFDQQQNIRITEDPWPVRRSKHYHNHCYNHDLQSVLVTWSTMPWQVPSGLSGWVQHYNVQKKLSTWSEVNLRSFLGKSGAKSFWARSVHGICAVPVQDLVRRYFLGWCGWVYW